MKSHRTLLLALVLLVAAVTPARAAAKTTLHVFAATSLLDAFDAIGKEFQKANPDIELRVQYGGCLLYTSPSPRDGLLSRMPSSA